LQIQNLQEFYKYLSSKEIAEGEQKKIPKKKGYFALAMQVVIIYFETDD